MRRTVVVMLTRAPYGRVHVPEGLRAARGVAAGFDRHEVTVVYTHDGVFAARSSVDRDAVNMPAHIADLHAANGRMIVDAAEMESRGIDRDEIAPDIDVASADEVGRVIRDADHVIDF